MLTVVTILATTSLFSLAMLLVLGSLLRTPVPGVRDWFYANLCMVISLPLAALRGTIPDFISIVVANAVLALGGALYYVGCAHFLNRPARWPALLSGIAAVAIAMTAWRYAEDNMAARVVVSTVFSTTICVMIGVLLLRHRPITRSPYNFWFAAALSFVFAATQAARGVYFLFAAPAHVSLLFGSMWNIVLLAVGAVIMPTMTMMAVMMIHDSMMARVEDAVNHDHLTNALSRKRFESVAHTMLAHATTVQAVTLLLIDLDHFKRINDAHGHAAGDQVLRAFVNKVKQFMRPGDALGRLGGEEFGLLLPTTTLADAARIAESLRAAAEQHEVTGEFGTCRYSISVGIATASRNETIDGISIRADRALYAAKNGGRNRVTSEDELEQKNAPANYNANTDNDSGHSSSSVARI